MHYHDIGVWHDFSRLHTQTHYQAAHLIDLNAAPVPGNTVGPVGIHAALDFEIASADEMIILLGLQEDFEQLLGALLGLLLIHIVTGKSGMPVSERVRVPIADCRKGTR